MKTVRLTIKGRVQGVYYRASTVEQARRLGVLGWVKNQADGSVLVEATGTDQALNHLISWCRQGPPMADVTEVVVQQVAFATHTDFAIKR